MGVPKFLGCGRAKVLGLWAFRSPWVVSCSGPIALIEMISLRHIYGANHSREQTLSGWPTPPVSVPGYL